MIFPWFTGERTPDLPNAVPIYWGFSLNEFDKSTLCRAVLEGHILNLYDGFRKMPVSAREIRLTGGLSRSSAWRQTIADVFEMETIPVEGEGAALGAAMHAAWIYFKQEQPDYSLQSLTDTFVKVNEAERKEPANAEGYKPLKKTFHEISARLRRPVGEIDPFKIGSF